MFVTLMYHIVDRRIESEIAVREEAFEAQLAHIRKEGYAVLTLADVLRIVSGAAPAPARGVFVTFDDGYADNLYGALPLLREYGVEGTMFVPTAFVGGRDHWNARPEDGLRFLDWPELERWLDGGGRIGGHTHAHETADEVGFDELSRSIELNRRMLKQRLGVEIPAFAYPSGVVTPNARTEVARHYEVAWTVEGGTWDPQHDRFLLNRLGVARHFSVAEFAEALEWEFEQAGDEARGRRPLRRSPPPRSARPREPRETEQAGPSGPRVALIAGRGDDDLGYPPGLRFASLLDAGVDVHLLHIGGVFDQPGIAEQPDRVLLQRIHPPPLELQRLLPRSDLLLGLLRGLLRRPVPALQGLARPARPGLRYVRAVLIALGPDVVHVPADEAAEWLWLKPALGARLVAAGGEAGSWPEVDAIYVDRGPRSDCVEAAGAATVIPRAVDPSLFEWPLPQPGTILRLLAIGPLAWSQGYEHLLHALRTVIDRGVPCACRIIGSGVYEDAVLFARHQLDLRDVVDLNDPGPRGELLKHLRWADLIVNSALEPAVPPWLGEAQAGARPLITTPLAGDGEEPAQSVPAGDPHALADAIELLARDAEARSGLALEARRRAMALHGMPAQLEAFEALYRELADV